jgi:hypothetical protein
VGPVCAAAAGAGVEAVITLKGLAVTDHSLQKFLRNGSLKPEGEPRFSRWYQIMEQMDDCFVQAGEHLIDPKPLMTGSLLLRCQYAFKTTAGLALGGKSKRGTNSSAY